MSAECSVENIPQGYKKTEAGFIPEDWDIYTIQQLIDDNFIVGHLDGNHGEFYPRSHEFKSFGIPYITANDFCGSKVSFKDCKYLSEERARRFRKGVAKNGDVLFAHNATVGPTALLSTTLDYVILSTTATYFRCNPDKLVNSFVLYLLQSPYFVRQYQGIMSQSTRNQVPITAQRKLMVVLPATLAEQKAIAEALSDADAFIESLKQLIAKKRQIKQGATQELLTGKKRLSGFSEKWKECRLDKLATFHKGKGLPKSVLDPFGIEPCIHYGELFTRYPETIEKVLSRTDRSEDVFRSVANDVLMPTSDVTPNGLAKASCVKKDGIILGGDILVIRTSVNLLLGSFLSYVIRHAQDQILQLVTGTTVFHLYAADMKKFTFLLPPVSEQKEIVAVLDNMNSDIISLEEKLAKARQIKQGMMQELLTGRIRLI